MHIIQGSYSYIADRRRFHRVKFDPPLPGRVGRIPVLVINMSVADALVAHDSPLSEHDRLRLFVDWYEPIEVNARVVRSEAVSDGFHSALAFVVPPAPLVRSLALRLSSEKIARLESLVGASKLVNSAIEPDSLVESILAVAREVLGVHSGSVYFVDHRRREIWTSRTSGGISQSVRFPIGRGLAGHVADGGTPLVLEDAYSDSRFDASVDLVTGFSNSSMLCVPVRDREDSIVGVLQFQHAPHRSFNVADLEFVQAISEHIAIAMRNAALVRDGIEKNRMDTELRLGREIQARLLPLPPEDWPGVEIAVKSVPCFEVGGDYHDFIELADGEFGLAIGDVSGKGVAAALIMSSAQAALRVAAPTEHDLARLIGRLDALLLRTTPPQRFATFFFAGFDRITGVLRYVNAGHNPPLLCSSGQVDRLETTGPPLGILAGATFREATIPFPLGSTLILYTDGFPEAANPSGEEFGTKRWEALVRDTAAGSALTVSRQLTETIARFERGAQPTDDKTLVVLRRTQ